MKLAQEAPSNYLITQWKGAGAGDSGDSVLLSTIRGANARERMVARCRAAAEVLAPKAPLASASHD
ncbi:MAG TPA: hypothetical protein PLJ71_19975 [Candidatus Hydrogenedentes bacterium]|nr:hypothetical protein [Candidatus Hydrogenedentota bacterium]HQM50970.1 hypothetical protein [Candidatus Hydrogenedentota bacterium]